MRIAIYVLLALSATAWTLLAISNATTLTGLGEFREIGSRSDIVFIGVPIVGLVATGLGAYLLRNGAMSYQLAWLFFSFIVGGFFLLVVSASRMG